MSLEPSGPEPGADCRIQRQASDESLEDAAGGGQVSQVPCSTSRPSSSTIRLVSLPNGREAMGNDDGGAAAGRVLERLLDELLGDGVEV